jgi:hypothetical protein
MPMTRTLLAIVLITTVMFNCFSQSNNPYYVDNRGRDALLAPRLGIGAGVFTFLGDVNDKN